MALLPLESQVEPVAEVDDAIHDTSSSGDLDGCVQVAVRVRPMLPKEAGNTECVDVLRDAKQTGAYNVLQLGGSSGPKFTFDQVFGTETAQCQVYNDRVSPLVENCLEGYNATVLAYGQTGSGKTHTIMGGGTTTAMLQEDHQGVLPRAIRNIFQRLEKQQEEASLAAAEAAKSSHQSGSNESFRNYEYDVRVQFLEIYGEEIRDLLNPRSQSGASSKDMKLSIRDIGNEEPEVVGATMHKVESAEEALLCLTSGMVRRVTASTAMNEGSSRSHAILSLIVEQSTIMNVDPTKQTSPKEHVQSKISRFNFVDLAGSERQKRTQATGQRLKEGININQGLLVLGNVISALGDANKRGSFVPYRDSKLTRLLKGSLGGNHKTLMIACVSPSSSNMEETLNCLRYANRAKNIQNHATVNLDATSQLVSDLKSKIQRIAMDLIKVKSGKPEDCTFPMSVIESLAEGGDAGEIAVAATQSLNGLSATAAIEAEVEAKKLRAENESYRIQLQSFNAGKDPTDALQETYMAKVENYEREIAILKNEIQAKDKQLSEPRRGRERTRSESPELSRLRSQMFGSMSKSVTLDAEVKAEEEAAKTLSAKYLKHPMGDGEFIDDDGECDEPKPSPTAKDTTKSLDADLFELSNSISAKEALIHQLQATQEKFETMREFYEYKLREMEGIVAEKEAETEKLEKELKKFGAGHSKGKEIAERLKEKHAQVAELRRKQSELSRLTNVASRNESQIARLKSDVQEMKTKKIDLQKQIASERKNHITEVKKMKKESMQKDRELNKAKREVNKKSQEASKAQRIAKARLEQMNHLKMKYKDTEKRLRMKTVKHGVLKKAGLDPVIFGRRRSNEKNVRQKQKGGQNEADVDKLRDFFDQKVTDVGRRENLAEKLAQEWEAHLELNIQKEDLLNSDGEDEDESLRALESAIKYREERIRQLASKLGKREKRDKENQPTDEALIFNSEFEEIVGTRALENGADTVAKVLFGMVVRERRRIASLARTASSLDEKVQDAETTLADKQKAFNAYVGEQRLDAAAIAQDQQQHILSLMEMVKEGREDESYDSTAPSTSDGGNSKLLVLANERIEVLERQLNETQIARNAVQEHQEREYSALAKLEEKEKECEDLIEDIDELRTALHHIRAEVAFDQNRSIIDAETKTSTPSEMIQDIVTGALHSTSGGKNKPKKSRRKSSLPFKSLTIETDDLHSDDSEEVPTWAEDIMADLAIIAEGKMPSSLLESQEVLDAEASFETESKSSEIESKHTNSVFDRLTNPKSFTGVQKQRSTGTRPNRSAPKIKTTDSFQSFDDKEKKKEKSKKKSKEKPPKHTDERRNVFDRLLSPSNLTGTQKQRFNRNQEKKGKDIEKAIENQHISVRGRSRAGSGFDFNEAEEEEHFYIEKKESDESEVKSEAQSTSSKAEDYSKVDVFERLSKTTTQAYKEKRQSNIAENMLDRILSDDESDLDYAEHHKENAKHEPRLDRVKEYASVDVFTRLTKTTTEAYANKKNASVEEKLLDDILSEDDNSDLDYAEHDENKKFEPKLERVKEYASVNVFERLTKITTEAYEHRKDINLEDSYNTHGSPLKR